MEKEKLSAEEVANWLGYYTHEVIARVMAKFEEIENNECAVHLIKELYRRTLKQKEDELKDFKYLMNKECRKKFIEYDIHNHPIEHAYSYRDVLYDMFIRNC